MYWYTTKITYQHVAVTTDFKHGALFAQDLSRNRTEGSKKGEILSTDFTNQMHFLMSPHKA